GASHAHRGVCAGWLWHDHIETIRTCPKPNYLGPHASSTRQGLVESFENDDPGTTTDHEPVTRDVIRTRRPFGVVVVLRSQRESKSLKTRGDKRVHLLSASSYSTVNDAATDKLIRCADAVGRGGTRRADQITASMGLEQVGHCCARRTCH